MLWCKVKIDGVNHEHSQNAQEVEVGSCLRATGKGDGGVREAVNSSLRVWGRSR